MKLSRRVGRVVGLAIGLALLGYAASGLDWQALLAGVAAAGWEAIAALAAIHVVAVLLDARAWQMLLGPQYRLRTVTLWRWIGESVNTLLPVAQIGGDIARAALAARHPRVPPLSFAQAGASVFIDVALTALAQIPFALLGLALWNTGLAAIALTVLAAALLVGVAARASLRHRAARFEAARGLDRGQIPAAWLQLRTLGRCFSWHFLGWIAGAVEIWAALYFLGYPISVAEALMLESLLQIARSAAFLIPGALGVQEWALLALAALTGAPRAGFAQLALLKRARELVLSIPGLLAWGALELRHRAAH